MSSLTIIAVGMLLVPPANDTPIPPLLTSHVRGVALAMELMEPYDSPSEKGDELQPPTFAALRERYQELKDAPPVEDSKRFPVIKSWEFFATNREIRNYLEAVSEIDVSSENYCFVLLEDLKLRFTIWDNLWDAKLELAHVTYRRRALKNLRDLLGEDDYYNGTMPSIVPGGY